MRIYDITIPLRLGMHQHPLLPDFALKTYKELAKGDLANAFLITNLTTNTGTHVDAPLHFIEGGASLERLPLDALVGPAQVVELDVAQEIGPSELAAAAPPNTRRLLLKTRNSRLWEAPAFQADYVYIAPEGARWLVERGVGLVGIDYISVAPPGNPQEVHRILLEAGVIILESLDLRAVPPGEYTLVCLPLKVEGADGCPARAILLAQD